MEILIVLAIIAILGSMSIGFYLKYTEQSKVSQSILPYAKNCLGELLGYCIDHPSEPLHVSPSGNCANRTTLYGNLTFEVPSANCSANGTLPENYTIKVYSTASDTYFVKCIYTFGGIKCLIEQR